jgi:MFS family permease
MISRFWSAGNYLLDAFVISLVLVTINNEPAIPLAWIWLILSAGAAIFSFFFFLKFPYQLLPAGGIAVLVLALAIVVGVPVWLAVVMGLLTLYRLHARFSVFDDGDFHDGHFLLVFVLLFSGALVVSMFNPQADKTDDFYALAIAATAFYVLFRLFYRYMQTRREGVAFAMTAAAALSVIGLSGLCGFLVYFLAEGARKIAGLALGGILQIVLWPFSGLMEKVTEYLSGLSTEQEMKETLGKLEPEKMPEETPSLGNPAAADFPVELMLAGILAVFFVLLVLWLLKIKPEKEQLKEKESIKIERYATPSVNVQQQPSLYGIYSEMDLQIIREAYRSFEQEAKAAGLGRKEFETVREWTERMNWNISDGFFKTYELVRYGAGKVAEIEAEPFLAEIKKIKEKYLKEHV